MVSLSVSNVSVASSGRASLLFNTPSPSMSSSHASPMPSRSWSSWSVLATVKQLSVLSPMLSASESLLSLGSLGNTSALSGTPSPSVSRVLLSDPQAVNKNASDKTEIN